MYIYYIYIYIFLSDHIITVKLTEFKLRKTVKNNGTKDTKICQKKGY